MVKTILSNEMTIKVTKKAYIVSNCLCVYVCVCVMFLHTFRPRGFVESGLTPKAILNA